MNMSINILNILRLGRIYITGNIQVIAILLFDLLIGNKASIFRIICNLLIECSDYAIDILFTQSVLVSVLNKSLSCIYHKDSGTVFSTLFIDYNNTSRYSRTVKQVRRQTDNAFDPALINDSLTNSTFSISTEQNTMRENDSSFTRRFQRF